ncbi:hypothetical protein LAZ40_10930 [Cereibacter sphaeroides]|uniref:hypothetical protein n=1 Tax=Cereibacter sphaeroides TaxID=1063 RepID=UPI001F2BCBEF|nr:hypothetical protein [Cereibacter sphaeroides]MCE6959569.1 hypothetical protein [Cereibacter sphaeroides]MCE6974571.1 hypothetical protein [Cereibacter sphaeroides]
MSDTLTDRIAMVLGTEKTRQAAALDRLPEDNPHRPEVLANIEKLDRLIGEAATGLPREAPEVLAKIAARIEAGAVRKQSELMAAEAALLRALLADLAAEEARLSGSPSAGDDPADALPATAPAEDAEPAPDINDAEPAITEPAPEPATADIHEKEKEDLMTTDIATLADAAADVLAAIDVPPAPTTVAPAPVAAPAITAPEPAPVVAAPVTGDEGNTGAVDTVVTTPTAPVVVAPEAPSKAGAAARADDLDPEDDVVDGRSTDQWIEKNLPAMNKVARNRFGDGKEICMVSSRIVTRDQRTVTFAIAADVIDWARRAKRPAKVVLFARTARTGKVVIGDIASLLQGTAIPPGKPVRVQVSLWDDFGDMSNATATIAVERGTELPVPAIEVVDEACAA